ncbi:MAG: mannose-1-phosphate guanylyltransferase [Planctomycetales bacterium]|nr:mannose-1-phosphate guanylyltransferase [Planctomycetales bacterium]
MLHAVIMAGGAGTRFWPESRIARPKQLVNLTGGRSMIQATVDRLGAQIPADRVLIVTNERIVPAIRDQLPQLPAQSVIGEPCKRDTAPCVGLAAFWVTRDDPDATMVVMPADHVIQQADAFQDAIGYAASLVEEEPERLVTFGIKPTYPAESFGYIERGSALPMRPGQPPLTFQVTRFREKPDAVTAAEYLASGKFYWNAGIFVWKAKTILDQLARHEPDMHAHLATIAESLGSEAFDEVFRREFSAIEGRSIDYAVMEHAKEVVVVEAPFDWDDMGSWQAMARLRGTDAEGNTIDGKHVGLGTRGTIVRGPQDHLIVTLGLDDCIVVHTNNATLVARKDQEEAIRDVVKRIESEGWSEFL